MSHVTREWVYMVDMTRPCAIWGWVMSRGSMSVIACVHDSHHIYTFHFVRRREIGLFESLFPCLSFFLSRACAPALSLTHSLTDTHTLPPLLFFSCALSCVHCSFLSLTHTHQGLVLSEGRNWPNVWMSHGTPMNESWVRHESWQAYEWVTAHLWMSHGTPMNESWVRHESRHTYESVTAHLGMCHGTPMNASWVRYESRHTYEWVMNETWHTHALNIWGGYD